MGIKERKENEMLVGVVAILLCKGLCTCMHASRSLKSKHRRRCKRRRKAG
jgi:hypothetical protein